MFNKHFLWCKCRVLACTVLLGLFGLATHAQSVLPVPALTARVIDGTGTLSVAQMQSLETRLADFESARGSQIVILLVPTTQPEDIASYANRVFNSWKIGRARMGDGLLLIVAKNDRRVRIEVSKALEGAVPDLAAKRVIDEVITPHFKQGDYFVGLDLAADQLTGLITGEALPAPSGSRSAQKPGVQWTDLLVLLFIVLPIAGSISRRILGNPLGSVLTGSIAGVLAMSFTASLLIAGIAAVLVALFTFVAGTARGAGFLPTPGGPSNWGGGGFGSDSGGGFGSGGFSSGGGGDGGGGGASGSW